MQSHVAYIESAIYPSKQIHKKHKNNFNNYMNLAFAQWTNICSKATIFIKLGIRLRLSDSNRRYNQT